MTEYIKIRFSTFDGEDTTAGLVIDRHDFRCWSMQQISRLFPTFETRKMQLLQYSREYENWEQAFGHQFADKSTHIYITNGLPNLGLT